MKRFCIMIALLILSLCSCTSEPLTSLESGIISNIPLEIRAEDINAKAALLTNTWSGPLGIYRVQNNLIYFYDYSSDTVIPLCNKPNCKHEGDDCNAYVPGSHWITGDSKFLYLYSADGKTAPKIIQTNHDGTNRNDKAIISGNYSLLDGFKLDGLFCFCAQYAVEGKDSVEPITKMALLAVDTNTNTIKEIYSEEVDTSYSYKFLGVSTGNAIFQKMSETKPLTSYSQAALDAEMNGHDCKIYSVELQSGIISELINDKSYNIDPVIMDADKLYYHSRKDSQIKSYDLKTKKVNIITENLSGYIVFLDTPYVDGKLLFQKDNATTDAYAKPLKENETFYVNTNNGEIKKVAFMIDQGEGHKCPFLGFVGITPDRFIVETEQSVDWSKVITESGIQMFPKDSIGKSVFGIIRKDDFWQETYNFIAVEWFVSKDTGKEEGGISYVTN